MPWQRRPQAPDERPTRTRPGPPRSALSEASAPSARGLCGPANATIGATATSIATARTSGSGCRVTALGARMLAPPEPHRAGARRRRGAARRDPSSDGACATPRAPATARPPSLRGPAPACRSATGRATPRAVPRRRRHCRRAPRPHSVAMRTTYPPYATNPERRPTFARSPSVELTPRPAPELHSWKDAKRWPAPDASAVATPTGHDSFPICTTRLPKRPRRSWPRSED